MVSATVEKVSEAPAEENPVAAVDPTLTAILKAVQDLSGRVSDMETRAPRTVVTRPDSDWKRPSNAQEALAAMIEHGENEAFGARTLPVTVNGKEIRADLFSLMKPRYNPGQAVRLRRDLLQDDESGKTIGELLDARGLEGVGEIKRIYWLGRRLVWKYRVRFPGLTSATGNGYYENQLEPY